MRRGKLGRPVTRPDCERLPVRVRAELADDLKAEAGEHGISLSVYVERILIDRKAISSGAYADLPGWEK